jgi:hypothetical protein
MDNIIFLDNGLTRVDINWSGTVSLAIDNITILVIGLVRTVAASLINRTGMSSNPVLLNEFRWHTSLYKKSCDTESISVCKVSLITLL